MKTKQITNEQKEEAISLFLFSFDRVEDIAAKYEVSRLWLQRKLLGGWIPKHVYNHLKHERASRQVSGENNPRFGVKLSQEQIENQRQKLIGFRHSVETKAKMSKTHTGKKLSEETIQRCKQNAASHWKGKKLSEEHRKRLGEAHKGLKKTPEQIERAAAWHRGRTRSAATKLKLSEAMLRRIDKGYSPSHKSCTKGIYVNAAGIEQYYDSSWELIRMQELDALQVSWTKRHHINIPYTCPDGVSRLYRPDFKIAYASNQIVIEEVKGHETKKDLLKYAAARAYCKERNWGFRILKKAHFSLSKATRIS